MSGDLFTKSRDPRAARYLVDESRSTSRDVLRAIVKRHGNGECAALADLDPAHLTAALAGRPGRNLDDHHIDAILSVATEAEFNAYYAARMQPRGKRPEAISPSTVEQRMARLEWEVAKRFGATGVALVEEMRAIP